MSPPKSYPELPKRLDRESVVEFLKATERAYKTNEILRAEGSRHSTFKYVDITWLSVDSVNTVDGGFVVHVEVEFGYGETQRGWDDDCVERPRRWGSEGQLLRRRAHRSTR